MEMVLCLRQIDANIKQLLCKQTMQRVSCSYLGGIVMITWLCTWWLRDILEETYTKGVKDGIDQERTMPHTTDWHVTLDENGEPLPKGWYP